MPCLGPTPRSLPGAGGRFGLRQDAQRALRDRRGTSSPNLPPTRCSDRAASIHPMRMPWVFLFRSRKGGYTVVLNHGEGRLDNMRFRDTAATLRGHYGYAHFCLCSWQQDLEPSRSRSSSYVSSQLSRTADGPALVLHACLDVVEETRRLAIRPVSALLLPRGRAAPRLGTRKTSGARPPARVSL